MKTTLLAFALAALAAPAFAGIVQYDVLLDANVQQVPVNGSAAFGEAFLTLDDVLNTLDLTLNFSGLTTNASAAHIHCCAAPGSNGPVVIPFPSFPAVTMGSYTHSFSLTPVQVADIESGLSYVNIHNSAFPGGEIRGNITAATLVTPEPTTMLLSACGLLGLAYRKLTRR